MLGTVRADQVSMPRAAGCHHRKAIDRGELNGVKSNTCSDKSDHRLQLKIFLALTAAAPNHAGTFGPVAIYGEAVFGEQAKACGS